MVCCNRSRPHRARRSPPRRRCSTWSRPRASGYGCQLFVGERNSVDPSKPATVVGLGAATGPALIALPMAGPPSADPATATTDIFYALQSPVVYALHSPGGAVRPGERVSVLLPLTGSERSLVVPTAAVVYDLNGGAWVYEATGATKFVRRRIEIRSQAGDQDAGHARHRRRDEGRDGRRSRVVRHRVRGGEIACAGWCPSRSATPWSCWPWRRSARSRPRAARNHPARCLPGVRAAAGRDSDRSARALHARSRVADQRAD